MSSPAHDSDSGKGAVEKESRQQRGNSSMADQLDHRSRDPLLKESDTDFPEPGNNPEHSGEKSEA